MPFTAASGVFIEYVNTRAPNGQTAVFMAAAEGHTDVVKLLVTAGANINVKDASGLTPLLAGEDLACAPTVKHLACCCGRVLMYRICFSLCTAVSNDKPATAMALIRKGGAVHVTDASGQSCLHLASAQVAPHTLTALLVLNTS